MKRIPAIVLASFIFSVGALAGTVTFDNFTPLNYVWCSVSSEGLTFSSDCNGTGIMYVWDVPKGGNGTPALILGYGHTNFMAITDTGGQDFNLTDFQMALSFYDPLPSDTVTLTAIFENQAPLTEVLTLTPNLQTFTFDFKNVRILYLSGVSYDHPAYWVLDNIDFSEVPGSGPPTPTPEPTSIILLATGALGLATRFRRA